MFLRPAIPLGHGSPPVKFPPWRVVQTCLPDRLHPHMLPNALRALREVVDANRFWSFHAVSFITDLRSEIPCQAPRLKYRAGPPIGRLRPGHARTLSRKPLRFLPSRPPDFRLASSALRACSRKRVACFMRFESARISSASRNVSLSRRPRCSFRSASMLGDIPTSHISTNKKGPGTFRCRGPLSVPTFQILCRCFF